ncbi:MAG: TonB-dependent receptor plug domain-containing protein, partial [Tannerella sp.]|nr:TonB-dependent receptor plug domain-containing protein [Tannerella sp.]
MKKIFTLLLMIYAAASYCPAQSPDSTFTSLSMDTVTVYGRSHIKRNNIYRYTPRDFKIMVSVAGEADALRYISTLPGVSQGMDGGMGFFVRGGNNGNNRTELDGAPLYGNAHLFGLLSVFPPEMVKDLEFRTGKIPAQSGNFLSSVICVTSVEADTNYHASLSISPFFLGGNVSGYITPKLSIIASGRTSIVTPELKLIKKIADSPGDFKLNVYDYHLNAANQLTVAGYVSYDNFKYITDFDDYNSAIEASWKNKLLYGSWKSDMLNRWQLQTLAYYSAYESNQQHQFHTQTDLLGELRTKTILRDIAFRSMLVYRDDRLKFDAGLQEQFQSFLPAAEKIYQNQRPSGNRTFRSNTVSIFGDVDYRYGSITASLGLRGSHFQTDGKNMFDGNIRAAIDVKASKNAGWGISYDGFSQFYHLVEGMPIGWSLDIMIPATTSFRPEKAHQIYGGGYYLTEQTFSFSGGLYYKYMDKLVSYLNGTNVFGIQNTKWDDVIAVGHGDSYGFESRIEGTSARWTSAISYTLSKSRRQYDGMNEGKMFPSKFDRRHIFNFTGQITTVENLKWKQYFNAVAAYSSGNHITIPVAAYQGITPPFWDNRDASIPVGSKLESNAQARQLMTSVNGFQIPYYFRIDIGYNIVRTGKHFTNELSFGIYNLLNR